MDIEQRAKDSHVDDVLSASGLVCKRSTKNIWELRHPDAVGFDRYGIFRRTTKGGTSWHVKRFDPTYGNENAVIPDRWSPVAGRIRSIEDALAKVIDDLRTRGFVTT